MSPGLHRVLPVLVLAGAGLGNRHDSGRERGDGESAAGGDGEPCPVPGCDGSVRGDSGTLVRYSGPAPGHLLTRGEDGTLTPFTGS
jgi:hypothetical protein